MQAVSDVCIRTSITLGGVDGYVKARVFGNQPSPDVDGCVAVSGKNVLARAEFTARTPNGSLSRTVYPAARMAEPVNDIETPGVMI